MRKKNYLRLKKSRKIARRKQKKIHDKLWSGVKGLTKDKDIDKISDDFISICDITNEITLRLRRIGYCDTDLK